MSGQIPTPDEVAKVLVDNPAAAAVLAPLVGVPAKELVALLTLLKALGLPR